MTTDEIKKISKKSLDVVKELLNKKPESTISVAKEGKEWKSERQGQRD